MHYYRELNLTHYVYVIGFYFSKNVINFLVEMSFDKFDRNRHNNGRKILKIHYSIYNLTTNSSLHTVFIMLSHLSWGSNHLAPQFLRVVSIDGWLNQILLRMIDMGINTRVINFMSFILADFYRDRWLLSYYLCTYEVIVS